MLEANLEDFLEAVLKLRIEKRVSVEAAAEYLGVKLMSAYTSVRKLSALHLLETFDNSKEIALTETGEELARNVRKKHDIIKRFLTDFLCVDHSVAEEDAHNLEHIVSDESLEKIVGFFEFIEEDPNLFLKWFSSYKSFVCPVDKG